MRDWNVLVTVNAGGWRPARRLLRSLGRVAETHFYNVLLVHADDPRSFLDALEEVATRDRRAVACLARVAPAEAIFTFSSAEEFEERSRTATAGFAQALAGKSFHVRIHRRGFRGRLSGHAEERLLAEALLQAASGSGSSARGLVRSARIRRALITVRREDFIPPEYRDHAYEEPGRRRARPRARRPLRSPSSPPRAIRCRRRCSSGSQRTVA